MDKIVKAIFAIRFRNPACSHTVQIGDKLCMCELKHGHEGSHTYKVRVK